VDSANSRTKERSFWIVLAGSGAAFALLGGLASLVIARGERHERRGLPFGRSLGDFGREIRGVGRATARGLGSGAEGLWDVFLEGGDVVRTRAKVAGELGESLREAGQSLRRAVGHLGSSFFGVVFGTISAIGFLSAIASVLMLVYMPDPARRQQFLGRIRGWLDRGQPG
jgi:hypothetical protein